MTEAHAAPRAGLRRQLDQGPRRASTRCASGPACTSATPTTAPACTTWSSRSSTTPSTRRWPATADRVEVTINADGSVTVTDNGRGIPVDIHEGEGVSAAEVIMTVLHAGGKFDQNSYKVSGGLHGVGVSVVNALSDWLQLTIYRDGKTLRAWSSDRGEPVAPAGRPVGAAARDGGAAPRSRFMPSLEIFTNIEFDLRHPGEAPARAGVPELRRDASSCSDERERAVRGGRSHYEGGVEAFVRYLDRAKTPLHHDPIVGPRPARERSTVEVALQWNDAYQENDALLHQQHPAAGRRHAPGGLPRGADADAQRLHREAAAPPKREKVALTGDDAREGLTAVLSVKVPDPKFSSQTKDKLVSSEVQAGRRERWSAKARRVPGSRSIRTRPSRSSARSSRPRARARPRARRAS